MTTLLESFVLLGAGTARRLRDKNSSPPADIPIPEAECVEPRRPTPGLVYSAPDYGHAASSLARLSTVEDHAEPLLLPIDYRFGSADAVSSRTTRTPTEIGYRVINFGTGQIAFVATPKL